MLQPDWVAQPMEHAADLSKDNQDISSHSSDTGSIYEEESLDLGRTEVYAMSAREVKVVAADVHSACPQDIIESATVRQLPWVTCQNK